MSGVDVTMQTGNAPTAILHVTVDTWVEYEIGQRLGRQKWQPQIGHKPDFSSIVTLLLQALKDSV